MGSCQHRADGARHREDHSALGDKVGETLPGMLEGLRVEGTIYVALKALGWEEGRGGSERSGSRAGGRLEALEHPGLLRSLLWGPCNYGPASPALSPWSQGQQTRSTSQLTYGG